MQVQKNVGKPSNDTRPRTSTTEYNIKQRRRLPPPPGHEYTQNCDTKYKRYTHDN